MNATIQDPGIRELNSALESLKQTYASRKGSPGGTQMPEQTGTGTSPINPVLQTITTNPVAAPNAAPAIPAVTPTSQASASHSTQPGVNQPAPVSSPVKASEEINDANPVPPPQDAIAVANATFLDSFNSNFNQLLNQAFSLRMKFLEEAHKKAMEKLNKF